MLMDTLFKGQEANNQVNAIDQLAIIVQVRKLLGSSTKVPIKEVHAGTNLVYYIKALCNWLNNNPITDCQ